MIKSNLRQILFDKRLSIREVARDIDVQFENLRRFHNDDMERYPRDLLDKLCTYLNVGVSDLLLFSPLKEDENKPVEKV